jgi:trehalose 6-phosphate synthase/phosphatase
MLLPALVRERIPDAQIGFFLHIPFPSYELFRMLPGATSLLEGVLGAGLRLPHVRLRPPLLSSAQSLLGLEDRNGRVRTGDW